MLTKKLIVLEILKTYDLLKMSYDDFLIFYNDTIHLPLDTDIYSVSSKQNEIASSYLKHTVLYSGVDNSVVDYRSHFIKDYEK